MQCRLSFMMKQYIEVYPFFHIVTSSSFHTKLVATKDLWLCKICLTYIFNTSPSEFCTRTQAWNTNMSKIFQSFFGLHLKAILVNARHLKEETFFKCGHKFFHTMCMSLFSPIFTLWARSYTFKISLPFYKKNALFLRKNNHKTI